MLEETYKATVLIVDDNAPAAEMISRIFVMRGFEAITSDNGEDAIHIAQTILPDIILLDIMMPIMDGHQVLEALRRNPLTDDIPVIFVTAKDNPVDIETGLGLGADDYITKPVKPREVLARVRSKIEARRLRSDIEKRSTELGALLRFSQELNNQLDIESLLNIILFSVLDLINSDAAVIYHVTGREITHYHEQIRADGQGLVIQPNVLFEELLNESAILWDETPLPGTDYPCGMAIHLGDTGDLHGILVVLAQQPFKEHAQHLFEMIAQQTTLALRNADLYATKVHYAEHLEEMVAERTEELRSAEQLLIRAEKLASVGRLAAGIAHEINNPLMPIRMNLEMMQEDIQNQVEITERDIEETLNSVKRISRIVKRLQQFTRGRGEDVPEMEPLNLSEIVGSVLSLSRTFIRQNGIELVAQLDENIMIYGNRDQLEQVLLNITLNAQAAMEEGGTLTISSESTAEQTIIRIADTGTGIPADMIDKIFEPFISTKENGSGLGLFISHNIIHSHSGQIDVQSDVGKGTTFIITLPTLQA